MKKLLIVLLSFLAISPLSTWASHPISFEDTYEVCYTDPSKEILSKVSQKFKALNSFQASFTLLMVNIEADINESQEGKIYYKKGNKYRLETEEIIRLSNNTYVWTLFLEEEEVQVNDFNPDDTELSPTKLFTIYEEGFRSKLTKKETINGVVHYVIDLTPTSEERTYSKIRIFVDSSNYMIRKGIVFERNNTRYTYELANFESNVDLNDRLFRFVESEYEDYEIIDLTE